MKRHTFLCLLLAVLLCIRCVPVPAYAEADVRTVYNLVLFAQFDHSSGYNFMDGHTETVLRLCSGEDTYRSLAGYINEVSCGAMQTVCTFPQLTGDTITPYLLTQESYASRQQLASEVISHVTVPADTPLDGDQDGVIDNIIIIAEGSAAEREDLLYPCAFSLGGGTVNGKRIGMVNLHNSSQLFGTFSSGDAGVLCHEFLHTLGYPDLYCRDRSGMPVGRWDIMASNSAYVQYPLAYMRASVSGWLETADITKNGTYTLAPASAKSGNRVYLLKTPLSDTEFFAVEYRQSGKFPEDEMDTLIYGSGMVVYRVNTEVTGNFYDKNQIYVFRPGETELDAGLGDLTASNYGGNGKADRIGTADPDAGIADGALVYSDGVNSGICIENITLHDDALTFDVRFAEVDAAAHWQSAAVPDDQHAYTNLDMAAGENGTVWLTVSDGTQAVLYTVSPGGLTETEVISGSGWGSVNEVQLAVLDDTPYLLYHDSEYRAVLCRLQDGSLQTLWKSSALAQYSCITAGGGKIYIGYTEGEFPSYGLRVSCYAAESGTVTDMGGIISPNACSLSAAFAGNGCAVAYRDLSDGNLPKLAQWENGAWHVTAIAAAACDTVSVTAAGDSIMVTAAGACEGLYRCADGAVETVGLPDLPGACFESAAVWQNGMLSAALQTQNAADFSVYGYDGTWRRYGSSLAADIVRAPAIAVSGGYIYTAFIHSSGRIAVRYLQHTASKTVIGDINRDGSFDAKDADVLLHWLCGSIPAPADPAAGDFDGNGILDARDLSLMKRALLAA